jgi:hypothetical protein
MSKFILALLLLASATAYADTQLGISGSVLYNVSDTDDLDSTPGADEKSKMSFGIGMRALIGLTDQLFLRTGAGIVQKSFSYDLPNGDRDYSFVYLYIPATLYIKASPQVGIFGGTSLNAKLSDDCDGSGQNSGCTVKDANSLVLPAVLGFDFAFNDMLSLEISYEHGIMETMKDTKVSSAVASIIYNFE